MSQIRWATTVTCDGCGVQADVPDPVDGDGWYQPASAPGWTMPGDLMGLTLTIRDKTGQEYRDFCPDCSALGLPALLARVQARIVQLTTCDGVRK